MLNKKSIALEGECDLLEKNEGKSEKNVCNRWMQKKLGDRHHKKGICLPKELFRCLVIYYKVFVPFFVRFFFLFFWPHIEFARRCLVRFNRFRQGKLLFDRSPQKSITFGKVLSWVWILLDWPFFAF